MLDVKIERYAAELYDTSSPLGSVITGLRSFFRCGDCFSFFSFVSVSWRLFVFLFRSLSILLLRASLFSSSGCPFLGLFSSMLRIKSCRTSGFGFSGWTSSEEYRSPHWGHSEEWSSSSARSERTQPHRFKTEKLWHPFTSRPVIGQIKGEGPFPEETYDNTVFSSQAGFGVKLTDCRSLRFFMCANSGGRLFSSSLTSTASLRKRLPSRQHTIGAFRGSLLSAQKCHFALSSSGLSCCSCFFFTFTNSTRVGIEPPSQP